MQYVFFIHPARTFFGFEFMDIYKLQLQTVQSSVQNSAMLSFQMYKERKAAKPHSTKAGNEKMLLDKGLKAALTDF